MQQITQKYGKRSVGILASTALIVAGLSMMPTAAFADGDGGPAPTTLTVLDQNPNTYQAAGYIDVEVTSDGNTADAPGSPHLLLYKMGSSTPVADLGTTGYDFTQRVTIPTSGYDRYYATLGSLTSNTMTVTAANNPYYIWMYPTHYHGDFSTGDDNPQMHWTSNQAISSLSGQGMYLVNRQTGNVDYKTNSEGSEGYAPLPRFFTGGPVEYDAYIADWNSTATKVSDLQNVAYISSGQTVRRQPWFAGLSADQWNADPTLDMTTNQAITDTHQSGTPAYAFYIVDSTTNKVITEDTTMGTSDTYTVHGLSSKERHSYHAVIAASTTTMPTNPAALTDVQYTGTDVSTQENGWDVTLNANATVYTLDQATPTLTWNVNQSFSGQNAYGLYLVNDFTGQIVYAGKPNALTNLFTVARGTDASYDAYIAAWNPSAQTSDDLTDIQAQSNATDEIYLQDWGLSSVQVPGSGTTLPKLKVNSLATVQDSYPSADSPEYAVYLINESDNSVAAVTQNMDTDYTFDLPAATDDDGTQYIACAAGYDPNVDYTSISDVFQNSDGHVSCSN